MSLELKCFSINSEDVLSFSFVPVSNRIFGCSFNTSLVHQVISSYLMNARQGSKAQKNRSEVAGSNRKPWRQKGTGRARSGSLKSPIWRSGGVTFAAKPKEYNQKINKKMYRGAMRSILSQLVCDNRLFLLDGLFLKQPKTKLLLNQLEKVTDKKSILIVSDIVDNSLCLASRNLYKVSVCDVYHINPVSLVNFDVTILIKSVLNKLEVYLI